jgi:hypothetical protein
MRSMLRIYKSATVSVAEKIHPSAGGTPALPGI